MTERTKVLPKSHNIGQGVYRHWPDNPENLLDEQAVARLLALSPATLRNWRVKGHGPKFQRLSARAIRYKLGDLETWLSTCARRSTSHTEGGDVQRS